jgi:hypothetical protein
MDKEAKEKPESDQQSECDGARKINVSMMRKIYGIEIKSNVKSHR